MADYTLDQLRALWEEGTQAGNFAPTEYQTRLSPEGEGGGGGQTYEAYGSNPNAILLQNGDPRYSMPVLSRLGDEEGGGYRTVTDMLGGAEHVTYSPEGKVIDRKFYNNPDPSHQGFFKHFLPIVAGGALASMGGAAAGAADFAAANTATTAADAAFNTGIAASAGGAGASSLPNVGSDWFGNSFADIPTTPEMGSDWFGNQFADVPAAPEIPTPRSFNADLLPGNSSGPIDAELFGPGNSSGPIDAELFPGNSANSPIPDLPGDYPAVPEGYGTEVRGLNPGPSTIDKILSGTGSKLLSGVGSKLLGGITGGGGGGDSGLNPGAIVGGGLAAIAAGTGSKGGAKGLDWDKLRNPPAPTDPINWGKMRMVGDDPYATTPSGDYSQLARDLGVSGAGSTAPTPHYTFGQPVNPTDILGMIGSGKSVTGNTGGALGNLFKPGMIQPGGGSGGMPDPESGMTMPGAGGMRGGGKVHADHPGVPVVEGRFDYRNGAAVNGPGDGQSDDIPAMLADGEYVIDAELVSMLGNGSNKAGAKVLDKFRESVRQHKRSAPLGKIPPKSKSPLAYLKEVQNG